MDWTQYGGIITGGSSGIGHVLCQTLTKLGAKVVLLDINTQSSSAITTIQCDVSSRLQFESSVRQAKAILHPTPLKFLINNAGIIDETSLTTTLNVNLLGVVNGTELFLQHGDHAHNHSSSVIINISSAGGIFPMPYAPYYAASKHAVLGYSKSIALNKETKEKNVLVHCVCPGFTRTDIMAKGIGVTMMRREMEREVELLGTVEPQEIADVMVRLLAGSFSDQNKDKDTGKRGKVVFYSKILGERVVRPSKL